jgi:hypothetical protein
MGDRFMEPHTTIEGNAAKLEAGSGVLARALQRHKWLGVSTFENRENRTEPDIVIAWRRTQRLLDPNPVG